MRASTEILADLEVAYASRRSALTAQEYSLDTGQGRQLVKRANLKEISSVITQLERELDESRAFEEGDCGVSVLSYRRSF